MWLFHIKLNVERNSPQTVTHLKSHTQQYVSQIKPQRHWSIFVALILGSVYICQAALPGRPLVTSRGGLHVTHPHHPSAPLPHLYALHPSASPLHFMLAIHGFQPKQANKQTEQQKIPSPRLRLRERWREILFAFWAGSISLWWQRRPPRTQRPTLLFDFQGRESRWSPELSHHLLT